MPLDSHLAESAESASPLVTRAVAAGLQDKYTDSHLKAWQKAALQIAGLFPPNLARWTVSRAQAFTSLDPSLLPELSAERLAAERIKDYQDIQGQFPVVVIGAALGGTAAHLSLAVGGPFLPQAFVLTLKGGALDGDVQAYFQRSMGLASKIARQNSQVMAIQHFDPVHDGWLTRWVNHLRLKLLDLPETYKTFLRRHLRPGGAVCYLDCGARWLRYRIEERCIFQVGGWGDIPSREFLDGSPRLERFCRAEGLKMCGWRLLGYPLEEGPESEWGSEPGLGEALRYFCEREGYEFVPISFPDPNHYTLLAYETIAHLLRQDGRQPAGVLVEMFSQFDATAVMRSGLLPVWLIFNTRDSLEFLTSIRPRFPEGKTVFFSPVVTFSYTPDMAPWPAWEEALRGLKWVNIGARPSRFPADTQALVNWQATLRRWVKEHETPIISRLSPDTLRALAQRVIETPLR